jgi:PAS domain S-box-containing protein
MTTANTLADQRLALAIEAARLGTWTWDMATGVTTWDTRLEEMHGLAPGGFGGQFEDWIAVLHPEDRDECLATVQRALDDPSPYMLFHRTVLADGSVRSIECRGTVLVDDAGLPIGTTGVAMDVTLRAQRDEAVADALAHEHRMVQTLQNALLPTALFRVPGTDVAARYVASETSADIGGDWYAILPLEQDRLGLAIGDVAGHGLHAVADMASARFSLRALALTEPAPEVVLSRLNDVVSVFGKDTMITAIYGVLDPSSLTWSYATAGHCPAVLRHADGTTELLDQPCDPPLGVVRSPHRAYTRELEPGATLVLYTDGLVERRNERITTGIERLVEACRLGPPDPDALCDHLLDVMVHDTSNEDDVALLIARCQPGS